VGISWHTLCFQKGTSTAAVDFCISMGGALYLGILASFIVSLRCIPDNGLWWTLLALFAIGFADSAAYFIGRAIGRHKLMPVVSPNNPGRDMWAAFLVSCLLVSIAAWVLQRFLPGIIWWQGSLLALLIATIAPLGDFGESMLKRQFNVKDSSHLIPGHGGAFDRIDSYLFTGILAYYLITIFF